MFRSIFKALPLLACGAIALTAQGHTPPKELIQYIRDAEKAGQSVFQIQQNAVDSGWSMSTVAEAISFVRDEDAKQGNKAPAGDRTEGSLAAKPEAAPADRIVAPTTNSTNAAASPDKTLPPAGGSPKPAEVAKVPTETTGAKPDRVNRGVPDDYQIGAGDVLEINVWKEAEASVKGAVVRTDGRISMPLLKEVDVVGLTPVQLEKQITDQLATRGLINTPDVTIIVTGTSSKKIYVQGKVKKEGPIPFNYRMTVMQALSEAGGLTDYANKKKIYILRIENGKTFRLPFDYAAVLKGQHLELNIQLQASDMIVVP